ncbi:MAG: rhomboid family intramembrane serine protease, partial [Lachnospiraceae bacterium]|nr:rhomboid family intramembrane serine protease [Lachnospiraceae bacterium]
MKNKFKITLNAPVTLIFVFICAGATLLNYITRGASNRVLFMTYRGSLLNPLTYVRLLTHVFGHEGWEHFIGNG